MNIFVLCVGTFSKESFGKKFFHLKNLFLRYFLKSFNSYFLQFLGRRRGHYESREGSGDGESYGVWAVNQSKQPWRESFYNRVEAAEEVHATGQYLVPSIDEGLTFFTTQMLQCSP